MPGYNRTGPAGQGPVTAGGRGRRSGKTGYENSRYGKAAGTGRNNRFCCRTGSGQQSPAERKAALEEEDKLGEVERLLGREQEQC